MGTTLNALKLLDCFTLSKTELGLSQIAREVGLNKATTLRYLNDLCEYGLLEQNELNKKYLIGPIAFRLTSLRNSAKPALVTIADILEKHCNEIGESFHLSLFKGKKLTNAVAKESKAHSIRVSFMPSEILPMHATASGYAFLAFSAEKRIDQFKATKLEKYTEHTKTEHQPILDYVERVKEAGWAENRGMREAGVYGFAAPVFDNDQMACGAIACAALESRLTPELKSKIIESLHSLTHEITLVLGGVMPTKFTQPFDQKIDMQH